jgi:hypothetical protein
MDLDYRIDLRLSARNRLREADNGAPEQNQIGMTKLFDRLVTLLGKRTYYRGFESGPGHINRRGW